MQRSKQQALMFLLGAVLVGGVLGFSADRVISAQDGPHDLGPRKSFYDEFGITTDQRKKMDSIFDETNCKIADLMSPVRSSLDSVKSQGRKDWLAVMTDEQRAALSAREARMRARRDSIEKARGSDGRAKGLNREASEHRRCGGGSRPMGPGIGPRSDDAPDRRGPGGPRFF